MKIVSIYYRFALTDVDVTYSWFTCLRIKFWLTIFPFLLSTSRFLLSLLSRYVVKKHITWVIATDVPCCCYCYCCDNTWSSYGCCCCCHFAVVGIKAVVAVVAELAVATFTVVVALARSANLVVAVFQISLLLLLLLRCFSTYGC